MFIWLDRSKVDVGDLLLTLQYDPINQSLVFSATIRQVCAWTSVYVDNPHLIRVFSA
jgi:hypothetical protein